MTADPIVLRAGTAEAVVSPLGAELRQWSVGGLALLWQPDERFWDAVAPLLFPVVGWTRGGEVRLGDKTYPLGLHGFARGKPFRVHRRAADSACLELVDDADTRRAYPFSFALMVEYRLGPSGLEVVLRVENRGGAPMPYACGLHPGFRWPFCGGRKSDYRIRFAEPESPRVPVITAEGLFASKTRSIPLDGCDLALDDALFAREALCFLSARSTSLVFKRPRAGSLSIATEDFPHWALWSRPGAPFLSIEAWTGHGDPADFAGDLRDKPSMRLLPPGGAARHAATFRVELGMPGEV